MEIGQRKYNTHDTNGKLLTHISPLLRPCYAAGDDALRQWSADSAAALAAAKEDASRLLDKHAAVVADGARAGSSAIDSATKALATHRRALGAVGERLTQQVADTVRRFIS